MDAGLPLNATGLPLNATKERKQGPATSGNSIPVSKRPAGKESNFAPMSAGEFLSRQPESIAWVWEPFLPEGALALLAAYMKTGKSTFAYALAVAVAQGRPFLGSQTKQGSVLMLAVEEHPRDMRRRFERFGLRHTDPISIHAGPLSSKGTTLHAMQDFIQEQRVALVVLDTLARFWTLDDENDNAKVMREVSPILDIARATNAAIVLVHHERKSGGEGGRGIRGGSALFGLVDQALILEGTRGGQKNRRTLRTIGRYEETPPALVLELVDNEYRVVGKPADLSGEELVGKVREALTVDPQTITALGQKTGLPVKALRTVLNDLGDVVRRGRGVKGEPFTWRLGGDSIPSLAPPKREERNSGERGNSTSPGHGNGRAPTEDVWSRPYRASDREAIVRIQQDSACGRSRRHRRPRTEVPTRRHQVNRE